VILTDLSRIRRATRHGLTSSHALEFTFIPIHLEELSTRTLARPVVPNPTFLAIDPPWSPSVYRRRTADLGRIWVE
jgi:hypothetical protein